MENKTQQGANNALDEKLAKTAGAEASLPDEDIEPVLDEDDMKENHLKEEDLDNIVWDKPAQPDQDLGKEEKDITD